MKIVCRGEAQIEHRDTKRRYVISANELDWVVEGIDERQMGSETHYAARVSHDLLGELSWHLREYPAGVENDRETSVSGHTIIYDLDYYLENTPEEEEELEQRISEIVEWFHENYEDPAERTPYESREGGYQWIWGGPFEAREVIEDHFTGTPEHIIEAAVAEIERTDYSTGPPPEFG